MLLVYGQGFSGCYDVVASEEIIREYDEVLHRAKFGFDDNDTQFIIEWFRENALFVEVDACQYLPDNVMDKKDLPFYVTAKATNSRLVTGNIKHYPVEEMRTMIWELV